MLGMKAVPPGVELDSEQKKFRASWKISDKIIRLKEERYFRELSEAQEMLDEVS